MKRTVLLVVGAVLLAVGVVMLAVGGWLLAAYGSSGTVTVSAGRVESLGRDRAVITDLVRVNSQVPFSSSLGTTTLGAAGADGQPLFLGFAAPEAVDAYLLGRPYTVATSDGSGGWTYAQVPGRGSPAPPGSAPVWTASGSGSPAEIEIGTLDGPVTLVVMRPDAGPRVAADLVLTFRSQTVFPLAVGLLVGGGVLALIGLALVLWARRLPAAAAPSGGAHAAGAPVAGPAPEAEVPVADVPVAEVPVAEVPVIGADVHDAAQVPVQQSVEEPVEEQSEAPTEQPSEAPTEQPSEPPTEQPSAGAEEEPALATEPVTVVDAEPVVPEPVVPEPVAAEPPAESGPVSPPVEGPAPESPDPPDPDAPDPADPDPAAHPDGDRGGSA